MNQLLIHNARIVYDTHVQPGGLLLRDGAVRQIFFPSELPGGLSEGEKLDAGGMFLAPGMIDIHIHGAVGVDVQNTDREGLARLSEYLLGEGVTGYLATFVPTDDEGYRRAIAEVERYIEHQDEKGRRGAQLLGIHFEGPFVSHEKCGALQRRHFRIYDGDPRSTAEASPAARRPCSHAVRYGTSMPRRRQNCRSGASWLSGSTIVFCFFAPAFFGCVDIISMRRLHSRPVAATS
jgi:N-acetylglucosamine-6-phosphate deacetylase